MKSSKVNNRLLIGYLTFVNEENASRRMSVFDGTFPTLEMLRNQPCDIMSVDNKSLVQIKEKIIDSELFRYTLHFDQNFYDTAVIYCSALLAQERGYPYVMYMYDVLCTVHPLHFQLASCLIIGFVLRLVKLEDKSSFGPRLHFCSFLIDSIS